MALCASGVIISSTVAINKYIGYTVHVDRD